MFRPFYLSCLAHASYLIADNGEAAVVDPQRDVDQYIDAAAEIGANIKYIIETHLHADFVSGHRELTARTGAEIVFGERANAVFPHRAVKDGDVLRVGAIELRAIETPGHTPESISWLIDNRQLLTGDTLFIGDVGRPDLAGARGYTSEQMAAMLYDSLHSKILTLADDVEVWPAHGAGSSCGRNISKERSSTIGIQRNTNYALRPMPRDEFVKMMTTGIAAPPPYFPRDAEINRLGARPLAELAATALSASAIREELNRGATVLDVRDAGTFGSRHIAGAINIGLGGQFASWCGTLLSMDETLVLTADDDARAAEAVMRLARVGMENAVGYTTSIGDLPSHTIPQISVSELRDSSLPLLDVRKASEFASGHVAGAKNVPLDELQRRINDVPFDRSAPLAVICGGGYRSSAATSILARHGFVDLRNVSGGTAAWIREGFATEQ